MIVTEDQVQVALEYLAQEPHPMAIAQYELTKAENYAKQTFARIFLSFQGEPIAVKEARATCNPEYCETKSQEADAVKEVEAQRAKRRWAELIIEVWRTANANARAAERVR